MLVGKIIVVGVCGGIAAYKAVNVVSMLVKLGAKVHVIMTENATRFVTALTLQTISRNPVVTDMFKDPEKWDIEHISLAKKADAFIIVPATANIIGKIACGIADDMLTTTVMATKSKVFIAPAMNPSMYQNPIVKLNIKKLKDLGYIFIGPDTGNVACGDCGTGRLVEPPVIVEEIEKFLGSPQNLKGRRVLITAGPTEEAIDPVRYITNRSSGKMGYAIAAEALSRGAEVRVISGPVHIELPKGAELIKVKSATEMHHKVMEDYKDFDILIMVAAVADYMCESIEGKKIKKTNEDITLKLKKTPDIAKELGKIKEDRILVGFSAETDDLINNAKEKLISKNFDMVVANDVTKEGAGFGTDTNIVTLIKRDGTITELPIMSKRDVARKILDQIS